MSRRNPSPTVVETAPPSVSTTPANRATPVPAIVTPPAAKTTQTPAFSNREIVERARLDAEEFRRQGNTAAAIKSLKDALAQNPNSAELNMDLGLAYAHLLNEPALAVQHLEASLKADAKNGRAIHELVQLYAKDSDPARGRAFLDNLAQANPDQESVHLGLAHLALKMKDSRGAEKYLEKGIQATDTDGQSHVLLSQIYARTGRGKESVEVLRNLVSLRRQENQSPGADPETAKSRLDDADAALTNALIVQGDAGGAEAQLNELIKRSPADPRIPALKSHLRVKAE